MTQFYVPEISSYDNQFFIFSKEFLHIIKSHRAKVGDLIRLFDGNGWIFEAKIINIYKDKVKVEILDKKFISKKDYNIILCQGLIKIDRFELVIEKSTEIGVDEIIPLYLQNCVVKKETFFKKYERFRTIILEASKQCNRAYIPYLHNLTELYEVFYDDKSLSIVCYKSSPYKINDEDIIKQIKLSKTIKIFIGPEGDFSDKEIEFLKRQKNVYFVRLGENILRSETASFISLGFVAQYKL